jgi:3-oxoadipate enol-lactonase
MERRFVTGRFELSGANTASAGDALPLYAHTMAGPNDAPWVTFVPGIGNDRTFWAEQASRLADRFRVLTFDPWGHGASPPPPPNTTFDTFVAGILTLWDALGIDRSSLVGLGFGGSVALAAAAAAPDRVDRAVAFCCRPRQPDDRRAFWRDRSAKAAELGIPAITAMTVDRWLDEEFRAAHPAIDAALRQAMNATSIEGYQAYANAFAAMDLTDRLGDISCPVQLVAAQHDHGGGPVEAMREAAGKMPGASFEVIPDSGHICVAEAPEAVAKILTNFFAPVLAGMQTPNHS